MNTLRDVRELARTINGDPDGAWMASGYIDPIIRHCYRLQILYLSQFGSLFAEKVAVLPNVPAGTSDLSSYQRDQKKALHGLVEPYHDGIHWKQAGQPDNSYRQVRLTDRLPDLLPGGANSSMWFEWRGNLLFISPMTCAIDLRVRGDFNPPQLLADDDTIMIHPALGDVLAEEAAACAWREQANIGQMNTYHLTATDALNNIANELVRESQGTPLRIGRYNQSRREMR